MKLKYIVKVSYHSFAFDDMVEANAFALMAKAAYVDKNINHDDIDVEIVLMELEDEDEGEPEPEPKKTTENKE